MSPAGGSRGGSLDGGLSGDTSADDMLAGLAAGRRGGPAGAHVDPEVAATVHAAIDAVVAAAESQKAPSAAAEAVGPQDLEPIDDVSAASEQGEVEASADAAVADVSPLAMAATTRC